MRIRSRKRNTSRSKITIKINTVFYILIIILLVLLLLFLLLILIVIVLEFGYELCGAHRYQTPLSDRMTTIEVTRRGPAGGLPCACLRPGGWRPGCGRPDLRRFA